MAEQFEINFRAWNPVTVRPGKVCYDLQQFRARFFYGGVKMTRSDIMEKLCTLSTLIGTNNIVPLNLGECSRSGLNRIIKGVISDISAAISGLDDEYHESQQ